MGCRGEAPDSRMSDMTLEREAGRLETHTRGEPLGTDDQINDCKKEESSFCPWVLARVTRWIVGYLSN